jgi:hypothetical protein
MRYHRPRTAVVVSDRGHDKAHVSGNADHPRLGPPSGDTVVPIAVAMVGDAREFRLMRRQPRARVLSSARPERPRRRRPVLDLMLVALVVLAIAALLRMT